MAIERLLSYPLRKFVKAISGLSDETIDEGFKRGIEEEAEQNRRLHEIAEESLGKQKAKEA